MSIKNNYKSKFLEAYLSTNAKKFVVIFVFLFTIIVSVQSHAQIFAFESPVFQSKPRTPGDDELFSRYDSIKSNLPFYFKTYALGGALQMESLPEKEVAEARKYVIPVPVLISNSKEISEIYETWRVACKFLNVKHKMELEKNAPSISTNSFPKQESQTSILKLNEQEQEKLRILEKELETNLGTDEQKQIFRQKQAEEEKRMILLLREQEKNSLLTVAESSKKQKDNKTSKVENETTNKVGEKLPELKLPDWTYVLFESESGLRWLFAQQVLADNILLCSPETNIPYYIPNNLDQEGSINEYLPVLKLFKQAFPLVLDITNSNEEKNALKKSSADFVSNYLKTYTAQSNSYADLCRKSIQKLKEFTKN